MCPDIGYLNLMGLSIRDHPHGHIRGAAFLDVTMMAIITELAIVGPIAPHRPLHGQLSQQEVQALPHAGGEALDLFDGTRTNGDVSVHRPYDTQKRYRTQGKNLSSSRKTPEQQDSTDTS
jgi:hypothetical protein